MGTIPQCHLPVVCETRKTCHPPAALFRSPLIHAASMNGSVASSTSVRRISSAMSSAERFAMGGRYTNTSSPPHSSPGTSGSSIKGGLFPTSLETPPSVPDLTEMGMVLVDPMAVSGIGRDPTSSHQRGVIRASMLRRARHKFTVELRYTRRARAGDAKSVRFKRVSRSVPINLQLVASN